MPRRLLEQARAHARDRAEDGDDDEEAPDWKTLALSREGWRRVAQRYVMEWKMVWKDVTVGFTVAGVIAVFVPRTFFQALFVGSGGGELAVWEVGLQALVVPVAAFFTFIGSMGNIPLAAVLFGHGVSFAGVTEWGPSRRPQRIVPSNAFEPSEVDVVGVDFSVGLDGVGGDLGVGGQVGACAEGAKKPKARLQMPRPRREDGCVACIQPGLHPSDGVVDRQWLFEDPSIRRQADETKDDHRREPHLPGAVERLFPPGLRSSVSWEGINFGVEQKVDVGDDHLSPPTVPRTASSSSSSTRRLKAL